MIIVEKTRMNNVPVLIVVESSQKDNPLPVVTYLHGFTSAKEHNLPFAYLMAEKGYRVLLPDSLYHGERENQKSETEVQFEFWNIILQNLKEIQMIKESLAEKGLLLNERFGIAGTSMGGITTSAALTQFPWIKVAAVLMGSPKAMDMANYTVEQVKKLNIQLPFNEEELQQQIQELEAIDLSKNMDKLNRRPLLFWHGDADTVVPFEQSYTFYNEVSNYYQEKANIHFIREKGRGHKVSRKAVLETVKWFERYL